MTGRIIFYSLLGIVLLLLILSLIASHNLRMAYLFETKGKPASATVVGHYTTTKRDSDGDTKTIQWLELNFSTSDGTAVSVTRKVTADSPRPHLDRTDETAIDTAAIQRRDDSADCLGHLTVR